MLGLDFHPADLLILLTLIFLEGVLSFDNAAILAALTRKLPVEQRRKALLYGLAGAYVFRIAAIVGVVYILQYPSLQLLGGAYLVFLAAKHFIQMLSKKEGEGEHVPGALQKGVVFGLNLFWSTVVMVELADIAFALDQVLVTVAYTEKVYLIVIASMTAILLLRLSAYYMGLLMDWFPQLEDIAYGVVGFVGAKLILRYPGLEPYVPHWLLEGLENKWITVPLTLGAFIVPVIVKFILQRSRREPPAADAEAAEPAMGPQPPAAP